MPLHVRRFRRQRSQGVVLAVLALFQKRVLNTLAQTRWRLKALTKIIAYALAPNASAPSSGGPYYYIMRL